MSRRVGKYDGDGVSEMKRYPIHARSELVVAEGDITQVEVEAIVNAANERMLGGGGVDGAIHRAAGPELVAACRKLPEVRPGVRCPTGEARITPGFRLSARWVIHTVGPIYESDRASAPLLAGAYRASLALANEHGIATIAFPAISCGVYGYPIDRAARIALSTCREHVGELREVRFVLFGAAAFEAFVAAADDLSGAPSRAPRSPSRARRSDPG